MWMKMDFVNIAERNFKTIKIYIKEMYILMRMEINIYQMQIITKYQLLQEKMEDNNTQMQMEM